MALGRLSRSRRTAPRTARSASKLCGGILEVSRSLRVATTATGLLSSDRHLELSGDFRMQADRHAELAERLDRLVEPDATPLDLELVLAEECGDIVATDGSKEPILIRGLPRQCQVQSFDGLGHLLRLGEILGRLAILTGLDAF